MCITHDPSSFAAVSAKSTGAFVSARTDGRKDGRTDGRTDGRKDGPPAGELPGQGIACALIFNDYVVVEHPHSDLGAVLASLGL